MKHGGRRQTDLRTLPLIVVAGLALAGPAQADMTPGDAFAPTIRTAPPLKYDMVADDILPEGMIEGDIAKDAVEDASDLETVGEGEASYYGHELAGNRTANGERFNPGGLTAAHRTLPMGSKLKVTNLNNGKSVVVRINDRGPFARGRVIDLSRGAAREINMVRAGKAMVKLELLR